MIRAMFESRLKSAFNASSDEESRVTSGGWPLGASPGRRAVHATTSTATMTSAKPPHTRRDSLIATSRHPIRDDPRDDLGKEHDQHDDDR